MEPNWKIVGQVTFRNGKRRYFRYSSSDLNPLGASSIAQDKDYANFFMKRMGYPTIRGEAFLSDDWAKMIGSPRNKQAAFRFARKLGFPLIIKPNSGSQGGNVQLVHSKKEFFKGLKAIFRRDRVALVQKQVIGRDYRIVVLDNEVISATNVFPSVIGDGRSSILSPQRKQREFVACRDTARCDGRIRLKLKDQLCHDSVLKKGEKYFIDNANLSKMLLKKKLSRLKFAIPQRHGPHLGVDLQWTGPRKAVFCAA